MYSVEEIAKKKDVTMAQIAVAWSLATPGVTAPIVGTTKLENLKEIIGKTQYLVKGFHALTADDLKMLFTSSSLRRNTSISPTRISLRQSLDTLERSDVSEHKYITQVFEERIRATLYLYPVIRTNSKYPFCMHSSRDIRQPWKR